MTKRSIRNAARIRTYDVIRRAVEEGAARGWRYAHKHVDNPSEAAILEKVENAIMGELCEVIDFDG